MLCVGIFVKHAFSLCIKTNNNFVIQNKGENNSYNIHMGKNRFSYELTFWFISIENGAKQKRKNTLRLKSINIVMANAIP